MTSLNVPPPPSFLRMVQSRSACCSKDKPPTNGSRRGDISLTGVFSGGHHITAIRMKTDGGPQIQAGQVAWCKVHGFGQYEVCNQQDTGGFSFMAGH